MQKTICKRCRASFGSPWRDIDDWQWDRDRVLCPHVNKEDNELKSLYGRYVSDTSPPDCYYAVEHAVGLELAENP